MKTAMNGATIVVSLLMGAFFPSAHAGGMSNELLTSSAWCTFTYNKTTGYSHTKRTQFFANGSYGTGSRGEGYSSGAGAAVGSETGVNIGDQGKALGPPGATTRRVDVHRPHGSVLAAQ